jgi:outer membrane protein assembly factor BamA
VTVTVTEGPRYRVRAATFAGDLVPEAEQGLRDLERKLAGEIYTGQLSS